MYAEALNFDSAPRLEANGPELVETNGVNVETVKVKGEERTEIGTHGTQNGNTNRSKTIRENERKRLAMTQ